MSLTIEISAQQLASTLKESLASDQWDLLEQVLAECRPFVTAAALEWIGQNGCGFHHAKEPGKEANALAAFISACYSRHDKGTPEGDAIRAAIKLAIQANDQKDNQ